MKYEHVQTADQAAETHRNIQVEFLNIFKFNQLMLISKKLNSVMDANSHGPEHNTYTMHEE
ncbi:hypothetical protein EV200_104408 [Pedobacter psychrotolerans]|uniref:Uncharacterized protein n=1 Tax=Pedobacter psychrotolerans TaxID=1843235 RepID=A0A4R2HGC5_9SPHI|nr:hypothetical protein [Pedobacter psychrotolerans]TCO25370.1 hypothetical protein EV200_104408 [Pedobacter psychrotolerans]GGE45968.1 hypothetical protein GCM10011413_10160 [Pedobacter psychrotolerans]